MSNFLIQNADRNVSVKDYSGQLPGTLRFLKMFLTIQGEGPFAGTPCVFLRLAGCNRGDKLTGCEFCDTFFDFDEGLIWSFQEIAMQLEHLFRSNNPWLMKYDRLVVISGGEPMIQNNLTEFCNQYAADFKFQIESNGDRLATNFEKCVGPTLIVSPKVVPSLKTYRRPSPEVMKRADYYKLLMDRRKESMYHIVPSWMTDFVERRGHHHVYLSPITIYKRAVGRDENANAWDSNMIDQKETAANIRYAADTAIRYGFRLSLQTHLFMGLE